MGASNTAHREFTFARLFRLLANMPIPTNLRSPWRCGVFGHVQRVPSLLDRCAEDGLGLEGLAA